MKNLTPATKAGRRARAAGLLAAKTVAGLFVVAFMIMLLYLLAAPILAKGMVAFRPRRFDLDQAQKYYALIAAAITSIVGASGVLLGAFYYFNRLAWETERSAREIGRSRLDDLYRRIDVIDELVTSLIDGRDDESQLRERTRKVLRALGSFEQLLESAADSARMTDEQLAPVVRLYSKLDSQCRAGLETNRTLRTSAGVNCDIIDPEEYWELLYDARHALQRCGDALHSRASRGSSVARRGPR